MRGRIKRPSPISGIYGIYCHVTDKWYVGASKDIERRYKSHMALCRNDLKMHRHYQRYGKGEWAFEYKGQMGRDYADHGAGAFSLHILEQVDNPALFGEREDYWIKRKMGRGHGYNTQAAGNHRDW